MQRRSPTPRQHLVLQMIAQGRSDKEMATQLHVSEAGIKKHLESLRRRYGVRPRAALLAAAIRSGDIDLGHADPRG